VLTRLKLVWLLCVALVVAGLSGVAATESASATHRHHGGCHDHKAPATHRCCEADGDQAIPLAPVKVHESAARITSVCGKQDSAMPENSFRPSEQRFAELAKPPSLSSLRI
jgi:hypothetical protein